MKHAHIVELLTLPGRPDPLFPNLQHIDILPSGLSCVPSLFFFVNPSLQTFSHLSRIPRTTFPTSSVSSDSSAPSDELMTVLPRMAITCSHLQYFEYSGPTDNDFLIRLCKLTSLKILRLTITNNQNPNALQYIQFLPLIVELEIEGLCLETRAPSERFVELLPKRRRLRNLRVLTVFATPHKQGQIGWSLYPLRLRQLRVRFFHFTNLGLLQQCIFVYLEENPNIEELSVEFYCQHLGARHGPTAAHVNIDNQFVRTATRWFPSLPKALRFLHHLSFMDIPYDMAVAISPSIRTCMVSCSIARYASFRVQLGDGSVARLPLPTAAFPSLSFLQSTVWKHSTSLEEFEFHFDKALVEEEPLVEPLDSCPSPSQHPLRQLTINTGVSQAESTKLNLSASRKADIAMLLDRLFPRLEVVSGTAKEVWDEVGVMVKAFQKQREYIFAQVDGILDRF